MSADVKRGKTSSVKTEKDPVSIKEEENGSSSNSSNQLNASNGRNVKSLPIRSSSPPLPTTFRDIPLYSTLSEDWKYHLMKLASFSKVDPSNSKQFPWPVKLNRKWPPKLKDDLPIQGDPVIDQWGKPVMIPPKRDLEASASAAAAYLNGLSTSESKKKTPLLWPGPDDDVHGVEELLARLETPKGPQADTSLIGPSSTVNLATRAKAGLFQKRVREVYKASSIARKTHNEEVLPWVLEDYETSKEWESRRKESRRGLKALQLGIKARREGGRFPSLPHPSTLAETILPVKKEEILDEDEKKLAKGKDNHAPWIGKLEGEAHESASTAAGGAMSHALFIFDERNEGGFKVVPVSRMYKFLQKPAHANNMSWEESEKLFERQQKADGGELSRIMMRGNLESRTPVSRMARAKMEEEDHKYLSSLSQSKGLSLPGMRFNRDDKLASLYDRDSSARRNNLLAVGGSSASGIRIKDEEGTYGEIDFEEDFADDEERNEGDDYAMNEDETKELEQRIKREMAKAEEEDQEEEEEDDLFDDNRGRSRIRRGEDDVLTGSGKQMKKIMKALARREGNDVYEDDDEDRNPYASNDSSDEDQDTVMANPEEALRRVREEREREAKEAAKSGVKTEDASVNTSRAVTPAIKTESGGVSTPSSASRPGTANIQQQSQSSSSQQQRKPGAGHATAAQRATSPARRASSQSRQGSRSGSPVEGGLSNPNLKRKSEVASSASTSNLNGKRPRTLTQQSSRPSSPGESNSPRSASPSRQGGGKGNLAPPNELEMEIIQIVQMGKAQTAKELISHFNARLKSKPTMRESFAKAVTRVLNSTPSTDANGQTQKILSVKPGLLD